MNCIEMDADRVRGSEKKTVVQPIGVVPARKVAAKLGDGAKTRCTSCIVPFFGM